MKKHCYVFLLASIFLFASQSAHGRAYISPRIHELEQYILAADPVKQKSQIEGDQKELALHHEGKTWKAKAVSLLNWAKRNPGKAAACGLVTAAAIGGLGYLAWNHWHLPTSTSTFTKVQPQSANDSLGHLIHDSQCPANELYRSHVGSELYNQAQKCVIQAPTTKAMHACTETVQNYAAHNNLPQLIDRVDALVDAASSSIKNGGKQAFIQAQAMCSAPRLSTEQIEGCANKVLDYARTHELPELENQAHGLVATKLAERAETCLLDDATTTQPLAQQCLAPLRKFKEAHSSTPGITEKIAQAESLKDAFTTTQICVKQLPDNAPVEAMSTCLNQAAKYKMSSKVVQDKLRTLAQSRTSMLVQQAHDMLKTYTPAEYPLTFVRRVKETAQKIVNFAHENNFTIPQAEELVQEMTFAEKSWFTRAALATNSIRNQATSWWNAITQKAANLCNSNSLCSKVKDCVSHPVDCGSALCKTVKGSLGIF